MRYKVKRGLKKMCYNKHFYIPFDTSYLKISNSPQPMPHFTPHKSSPNSKQLAYVMAFARFYDAETHNEDLARTMASTIAETIEKNVVN